MKQFLCVILFWLACINCSAQVEKINTSRLNLYDSIRNRSVPVNIYYKTDADSCYKPSITQIVIISNGYGIKNTDYSFIAHRLVEFGYFVVSIQHDLPTDEPLARTGNIYELRKPIWERGVDNINFVISWLKAKNKCLDYSNLILIGHSNGGDISMLYCTKYKANVSKVISLDHLRMPIPHLSHPKILSIRANDTQADNGVIPCSDKQKELGIKLVYLKNSKHNDMCNNGNTELKQDILLEIENFIRD